MTQPAFEEQRGSDPGVVPPLLDLDDTRCTDPLVAGGKAAWLARAREAGLPVLPGLVVTSPASVRHLSVGVDALSRRGSGGARLEVSMAPLVESLAVELTGRSAKLGGVLVVRSSSVLEAGAEWSGAFTSYLDVGPAEVPRAVTGCWASAFGVATLERHEAAGVSPGSAPMAVLIQPALEPAFGGTARFEGVDVVITAIAGSPAPLVQGWEPGVQSRVRADGTIRGESALDLMGADLHEAVAAALHRANATLGATDCEWAIRDGEVILLQLMKARRVDEPSVVQAPQLAGPPASTLARLVRRYPGALGEALVLPWAVGAPEAFLAEADPVPVDPREALASAAEHAAALTAEVWALPKPVAAGAAAHTLRNVRASDPAEAWAKLSALRRPDPDRARLVLSLLATVRSALVDAGAVTWASLGWYLAPTEIRAVLEGGPVTRRQRIGFDRWEPFDAAVVATQGRRADGAPSAPGVACGRLRWIPGAASMGSFRPREVIVTPYPTPSLAALLWDAAGIVTTGGGPAAHLFESARALAIPAVSGASLDDIVGGRIDRADGGFALAVDGSGGSVFAMEW